jgi:cohesin loading factor subunit SCC2
LLYSVSSAIVQRYIHHILEAAITPLSNQALLRPALEAIGFTVKQGLAHPMQCLPVLVALETCPDPAVSAKAFSLHSQLHEKHSALINTRLAESINTVIKYQNRLASGGLVTGYAGEPPCALLSKWYSLMREKRQWRLDFLKAFVRGLHVEPTTSEFNQVSDLSASEAE